MTDIQRLESVYSNRAKNSLIVLKNFLGNKVRKANPEDLSDKGIRDANKLSEYASLSFDMSKEAKQEAQNPVKRVIARFGIVKE